MNTEHKKTAAMLARQYLEKEIDLSFLIEHYPKGTQEKDINSLLDLITISPNVDVIDSHAFKEVIITLIERLEK